MKVASVLAFAFLAPSAVSAWMCNCRSKAHPDIEVALKFCGMGQPGTTRCYNAKTNAQACIMSKPLTQQDCDAQYGGKGDWIVECQHYTGSCPPGMNG